ncbi:hypothetical protein TNCV_3992161 [Trichonephila clavipes]|uniref:Uncharacterized protein n=1 Tax=Trichonephila clavipes TaxID=2585209 RepID=A0A8X6VJL4_TRICX|nr:hypothetical protein TNCV_3992161 [Trichonephila clavipes]
MPKSSLESEILNVWIGRHDSGSQSHRACMGFSRQTLGSWYLTTSNTRELDWRCKTNGQQCLNISLTPSFLAWAEAVKSA